MDGKLIKNSLVIVITFLLIASIGLPIINAETLELEKKKNDNFSKIKENSLDNNRNDIIHTKTGKYPFVPGEIILKFKEKLEITTNSFNYDISVGLDSVDKLNTKHGVISTEKIIINKFSSLENVYKFSFPKDSDIVSIINDYNQDPSIEYVEPNYVFFLDKFPNDQRFSDQWALHNLGQTGGTVDVDIDAPEAWDIQTGNSDVTIAIIDGGIDLNHPDLADNIWVNYGEIVDNQIDDDGNGFIDDVNGWDFIRNTNNPKDEYGHGTHCAGIVGAVGDNSIGISGVCWNCSIMPVKVFDEEGYSSLGVIFRGIIYAAENGVDVISMSWSGPDSLLLEDILNIAYSKGVVLVSSAGNGNSIIPRAPAMYDSVISVAAIDNNNSRARFSNFGNWVDVAAPGVDILSTMPTYHVTMNNYGYTQEYSLMSGTSMSAPCVAGVIGLILSKNPNMNQNEIKTLIQSAVTPVKSTRLIGFGNINLHFCMQNDTVPIVNLDISQDEIEVKDLFEIKGSASGASFNKYNLLIGPGVYPTTWNLFYSSLDPIEDGLLTTLDTKTQDEGLFTIKLEVEDIHGNKFQDILTILINNKKDTVYVDDNNQADYKLISEAVNNSGKGDIVYVNNGTYNEFVFIDSSINLIGENKENTIFIGSLVCMDTINVEISGFTFRRPGPFDQNNNDSMFNLKIINSETDPAGWIRIYSYFCVLAWDCGNLTIKDNIFSNFTAPPLTQDMIVPGFDATLIRGIAIDLTGCSACQISNNIIKGHIYNPSNQEMGNSATSGINLFVCDSVFIENNEICDNNVISGVDISYSDIGPNSNVDLVCGISDSGSYNSIKNNIFTNNLKGISEDIVFYGDISDNLFINNINGIFLEMGGSYQGNIHYNTIIENKNGISIVLGAMYTNIKNNIIENNSVGIQSILFSLPFGLDKLFSIMDLNISGNSIKNNKLGINGEGWSFNTIYNNNFENNSQQGLLLINSKYNVIYHNNFINNGILPIKRNDAFSKKGRNEWDNGMEGNYWDNYKGLRFLQFVDPDDDGFGNLPYIVPRLQFDWHPKLEPYDIEI